MDIASLPQEFGGRFVRAAELAKRPSCTVFRGTDKNLKRDVAIKVFIDRPSGNADFIKSFEEEITLFRAASHSALVPIVAGGESDGWFYIAMELISGPTLRDRLKEFGKFGVETAVDMVAELAQALGEIHEKNGVHGHLDTRGILFKGEKPCVAGYCPKTIDQMLKNITSDGRLVVDPAYIAPEQIEKADAVDGRADIYALTAILFEMITGSKPFTSKNPLQLAMMRLSERPPSPAKLNSEISPLLDAAVLKGLSRDPAHRFKNIEEFIDAITGGKRKPMNPLLAGASESSGEQVGAMALEGAERFESGQTIAVSMSAESIKKMLAAHEAQQRGAATPPPSPKTNGVEGTFSGKVPEGIDMQATLAGVDSSKLLKASFIAVEGGKKGERFILDKAQTMIGSDPGCDIYITDKGVPKRYALVAQRGNDFLVEALSGQKVSLNGHECENDEEIRLKRGDIINVGNSALRFVAPGEVFTLQKDVADRTIDRPKSRMMPIIMCVLIALVAAGGYALWYQSQEADRLMAKRAQEKKKTEREREDKIASLIREGDEFFNTGALTEPVGANAKERFQVVLEINPDHPYAKQRLADIREKESRNAEERTRKQQFAQQIDKLLADGDTYFRRAEYIAPPGKNARDAYQQVLRLDSTNEVAKKRIAEIDKLIGDIMGRVGELLTRARSHADAGQYVLPKGESAYDVLQEVFRVDPQNVEAKGLLIDMAAKSIFNGDRAKQRADAKGMKRNYLTAQALGVDPEYVKSRMQGIDTMIKSASTVVVVGRSGDGTGVKCKKDERYLDCEELEKRIAGLAVQAQNEDAGGGASDRTFIDLNKGR